MKNIKLKILLICTLYSSLVQAESFWNDMYNEPTLLTLTIDNKEEILGFFKLSVSGDLKLLEIVDGDPSILGVDSLFSGINMTECNEGKCDKISYIEFNKSTGALEAISKKDTIKKDIRLSKSIKLGAQTVISNDSISSEVSAITSLYDYQLVTDGLIENNTYRDDNYRLNNAFIRKKLDEHDLMYGLFTTNNVNYGYSGNINAQALSALGLSIKSKDSDEKGSVRNKIYITLTEESFVEVFKGDQLIDSLVLGAGLNEIDTSTYPPGNYVVSIKVKSRVTSETYVREEYVYTSNLKKSYGIGVGLPYDSFENNIESALYMSAYFNAPLTRTIYYGAIVDMYNNNPNIGFKLNYNKDNLNFSFEPKLVDDDLEFNINSAYSGRLNSINNNTLIKEDRFYTSTNLIIRLPSSDSLRLSHRYDKNEEMKSDAEYYDLSLSYDTKYKWNGISINTSYSVSNRNQKYTKNSTSFSVNFSLGFDNDNNLDLGASLRSSEAGTDMFYNAGYRRSLDNEIIQSAFVSASSDGDKYHILDTGLGFDNEIIKGTLRASRTSGQNKTNFTGNISANLHSDFSNVNIASSTADSGIVVSLENNSGDEVKMLSNIGNIILKNGDNFIPVPAGTIVDARFVSDKNFNLSETNFKTEVLNNGYSFMSLSVTPTITVIGRVISKDKTDMSNVLIKNHISETYANKSGYFILNVDLENPNISIGEKVIDIDTATSVPNNPVYLEDIYI